MADVVKTPRGNASKVNNSDSSEAGVTATSNNNQPGVGFGLANVSINVRPPSNSIGNTVRSLNTRPSVVVCAGNNRSKTINSHTVIVSK